MNKMNDKIKHKNFSCTKCGVAYEAYPPDDKHSFATMVREEAKKDHVVVKYTCKSCGNFNIIYWTHPPSDLAYHV
jgi:DNA-directed RNA polymerase subunit M/transcription elongation factor TFIIS